jgi:hypothetical protein
LVPLGDDLATDYQLSRALEMLKGLDVFGLMAKEKASVPSSPAKAGGVAK